MDDELVFKVMEKVELCIRRAVAKHYPDGVNPRNSAILTVAEEINYWIKERRDGQHE